MQVKLMKIIKQLKTFSKNVNVNDTPNAFFN